MSAEKLLRGRVLSFLDEPDGVEDTSVYTYAKDGAILIRDGLIVASGEHAEVALRADSDAEVVDHRPKLLMPGFIDTHIHFPQVQVIGSWADQLLDWLNTYTFPEETKFADPGHSARIASLFFDELLRHGTTTAAAFCSVHKASADAFFGEAEKRNLRMIGGKVMMDRNAPEGVCDTPQSGYDDSKALISQWHGKGRGLYAVTPRFAITSTPEQMEMAQALSAEHPDCYVQTHLSENHDEIALTAELYPEARDYLDVYEHYGLLGPKCLFGHCIHLTERERSAMAETGSVAVFCPTSNLFLGSGLFDEAGLKAQNVRRAIATDVGGGTNYSMLRTLDEGFKILQLQRQRMHPLKSFYWITLGNARCLSLEEKIGTLDAGTEADIVVLDSRATSAMALRMETVTSLSEELFVLQTLGDDRSIAQTYVAGEPVVF
ncbi:MAG: guanine deaminase [Alphaproteobacteria bacterium]|nr:guanine deaminase [Alphaproteobacteria bacterium]